ncbi:hypothetical protein [uncultured Flavobacterium sp.]|mgnify:CR=1 FL=1|uniref:TolB family protein n=1 Tax=uncultured Flavobacterium sp. TaxID=165435 RepID=UPI0030CA4F8B
MNSDGTNVTQLTNNSNSGVNGTTTEQPTFSNSNEIYYVSNASGISQIYKMNNDGTNKTQLTTTSTDKFNPIVIEYITEGFTKYLKRNSILN